MSSAPAIPRWTRPVPKWEPTLDQEKAAAFLAAVRQWTPFDGHALLDDIGAVLDDVVPAEDDVEELAERLRGHLMRLVNIALAAEAEQREADRDEELARLIAQARDVRAEEMPGDHWRAVGHLRRMAWSTNELLERLGALRCLKEYA